MKTSIALGAAIPAALLPLAGSAQLSFTATSTSLTSTTTSWSTDSSETGTDYGTSVDTSSMPSEAWVPGSKTAAPDCSAEKVYAICGTPAEGGASSIAIDCSVDWGKLDCDQAADELGLPRHPDAKGTERRLRFIGSAASGVRFDCDGGQIYAGPGAYHYDSDIVLVESLFVPGDAPSLDEQTQLDPRHFDVDAQILPDDALFGADDDGTITPSHWERPEDVTITNCEITGGVRILGLGGNGEGPNVRRSSLRADHVQRARERAPTRITLDNVLLAGVGRTPLYFAPGVTDSTLIDSQVRGYSRKAAIYLDAESSGNRIENNIFNINTDDGAIAGINDRGWPQIAVDASSHNTIVSNVFQDVENGGIYLYRNCGEGGTIRHSTPSWNTIMNNVFWLDPRAENPAIYIGSRDYDSWYESGEGLPGWTRASWLVNPWLGAALEGVDYALEKIHCNEDEYEGSPYGSGISNSDHARYNAVMQNQFITPSSKLTIQSRDWSDNEPNFFADDREVDASTVDETRPAGCFLPETGDALLPDGESRGIMRGEGCYEQITCENGEAVGSGDWDCGVRQQPFECQVAGDDRGCSGRVTCRAGERLVAAKAACNLEYGRVPDAYLEATAMHRLSIETPSDDYDGECYLGDTTVSRLPDVIEPVEGLAGLDFGCSEHDDNGGDCHISGIAYCLAEPYLVPITTTTYFFSLW